jgi:hypothetical protein
VPITVEREERFGNWGSIRIRFHTGNRLRFLPEKDAPIFLAAIQARATHLLTGDLHHFAPYSGKKIEGIMIVLPGKYLRMRASEG